jgi:hypothetical protein
MSTVIENDVGVDVMTTIEKSHVIKKEVFETPEIVNEGMGVDVTRGVQKAKYSNINTNNFQKNK